MVAGPLLVRLADVPPSPWRNGRGTTRELLSCAGGGREEPDWRISVADVDREGAFSRFLRLDRVLVPCGDHGLTLVVDGAAVEVPRLEPFRFAGESDTTALLPHGPTRALNVMVRRGVVAVSVDLVEVLGPAPLSPQGSGATVLVALPGSDVDVEDPGAGGMRLGALDALVVTRGVLFRGSGAVLRVALVTIS